MRLANGKGAGGGRSLKHVFAVRNRTEAEGPSFDLAQAERQLFSAFPWTDMPAERRGNAMFKEYLATLLSAIMSG